jgi:L-2,4-diaminobutyric acid acetyltransferase
MGIATNKQDAPDLTLRPPRISDGAALHALVAACPPLDLNSVYAYLLLCHHHAPTCVIAECGGRVAGAITAYVPPLQQDTLFIWQVAVHPEQRGRKLGSRMLDHLFDRCVRGRILRWIETTIGPANEPSRKLFASLAQRHGTAMNGMPLFTAAEFGQSGHEEEFLYRLGPCESTGTGKSFNY